MRPQHKLVYGILVQRTLYSDLRPDIVRTKVEFFHVWTSQVHRAG